MAFQDNPTIDDNAHRSEESVNAVKSLFTGKRGFRCRDQNPDNGVDQSVELLHENKATGKLFGIQIKSTQSAKISNINGQSYLVWQFKTSRLGYLLRYAPPGYGLVVLYIEETQKCYFDYADDITIRADEMRGNDEWKEQDTVTVHIPYANELTAESISEIYSKLTLRFQNHDLLLAQYGMPLEGLVGNSCSSFVVRKFPLEKLEEGIAYLVQGNEFGKICQVLSPYKHGEIGQFKKVCLFGTYAWLQIGHVFEAKSLLMRCKRFESVFNSFEREVYIMTKHRLSWLAGDTTLEEFGRRMEVELVSFQDPINIINVRMSLLFLKVGTLGSSEPIKEEMDEEMRCFFREIETLDIKQNNKQILIMQHCETISGYMNSLLRELVMLIRINRSLGRPPLPGGQQLVTRINTMAEVVTDKLMAAEYYAKTVDDKSLQITTHYRIARHFLHVQFTLALGGLPSPLTDEIRTSYQNAFITFIYAYNQYITDNQYHEAYLALHNAADTKILFRLLYNEELRDDNGEELLIRAQEMENELGFIPYKSQIEEGLRVITNLREHPEESRLKNATDVQLNLFARQIQTSLQLPADRLNNILHELKAFRRFEQVCQNPDIEMLSNAQSVVSQTQLYAHPPSYKLRSRKTGLETLSSTYIEQLLYVFRHLMIG